MREHTWVNPVLLLIIILLLIPQTIKEGIQLTKRAPATERVFYAHLTLTSCLTLTYPERRPVFSAKRNPGSEHRHEGREKDFRGLRSSK